MSLREPQRSIKNERFENVHNFPSSVSFCLSESRKILEDHFKKERLDKQYQELDTLFSDFDFLLDKIIKF